MLTGSDERATVVLPRHFLLSAVLDEKKAGRTAVVLVNSPSNSAFEQWISLWNGSALRACTDGAANRVRKRLLAGKETELPDFISGDLDSIKKETCIFFKQKGVNVVLTDDQDHTDFTKCLSLVSNMIHEKTLEIDQIVALGGLCGRFDHTLGAIQSLFLFKAESSLPVYLLDSNNFVTLLHAGTSHLEIDLRMCSGVCGLVPIGRPARVTSSGLKWNLDNQTMAFGELVSTSNEITSSLVSVTTDSPLVWTMELADIHGTVDENAD